MIRRCVLIAVAAAAVLGLASSAGCVGHNPAHPSVTTYARGDRGGGQPAGFGGQRAGSVMADVSCPAAGACAAVGMDHSSASGTGPGGWVPFIVNQAAGIWGTVQRVAGLAALTDGKDALFSAVSCASAGNCTAVGGYAPARGKTARNIPFAVSEVGGTWGRVTPIPGIAGLTSTGSAHLVTVSCMSPGNCMAAGSYALRFSPLEQQAFVVSQVNGTWQAPRVLPGIAALNTGRDAAVESVSCHAGACVVGGYFSVTSSRASQPFVAAEKGGTWDDPAQAVPGLPVPGAHQSGNGSINQVTCVAAGRCMAVGSYLNKSDVMEAFAVSEKNDAAWHHATVMPGASALQGKSGQSSLLSLSCGSGVGNCSAGGVTFRKKRVDGKLREFAAAFVTNEHDYNSWGPAKEVSGSAALNKGSQAAIESISCAGNYAIATCTAAGYYTDGSGSSQAMVVTETNAVWGRAIELPGSAALNTGGYGEVTVVSCGAPRNCSAGGVVTSKASHLAFVASGGNLAWSIKTTSR